jgi:hypothetical protein
MMEHMNGYEIAAIVLAFGISVALFFAAVSWASRLR